jgi:hypothetical protein
VISVETPAQRRAKLKYRKEKRKQIVLEMSIDEFESIDQYCTRKGFAKATFIKAAIKKAIEADQADDPKNQ